MFTITTNINITKEQVSDLICTAIEGGSNYWYMIEGYQEPSVVDFRCSMFANDEKPHRIYDWPLCTGGGVIISAVESDRWASSNPIHHTLNLESITKGLTLMGSKFPERLVNISNDDYDAEDADIFLQLSLFGDVIFG
jgi:hypothetical protein